MANEMNSMETLQAIVDKAGAAWPTAEAPLQAPIHTLPDREARHRGKILKHLDTYPVEAGGRTLHMGVAGYFNFDVICKTRPGYVLLMDANANQQRFWEELFTLIAKNPTAEGFAKELGERLVDHKFVCADGTLLDERFSHEDPMYALQSLKDEGNYAYLHRLAKDGHAAFATVNLVTEAGKCNTIGQALREAGFNTTTAYWSNIGSFFHASRRGVLTSRDQDMYGLESAIEDKEAKFDPNLVGEPGLHYKNRGFYQADGSAAEHWKGYASQEERNAMDDSAVPPFERFLENTSALGGLKTVHMHSHASDRIQNIKRFPLMLSDGPLRRLPEQIAQREQLRTNGEPMWQGRVETNDDVTAEKSR